jgi:hypothetical protein
MTAGMVFARILKSSPSDHWSMYCISSSIHFSKGMELQASQAARVLTSRLKQDLQTVAESEATRGRAGLTCNPLVPRLMSGSPEYFRYGLEQNLHV